MGIPADLRKYIDKFEYNNVEDLKQKLSTERYAAVMMEPVSLEPPKDNFLQKVRALCDKYNTIFILDEMVTGFRFSSGGASKYFGVEPDIVCLGKILGGGTSISAISGKAEYLKEFENVFVSGTYFSESLSICSAIATLEYIRDHENKIYPYVWRQSKKIQKTFNKTCKKFGIDGHSVGMAPRWNVVFEFDNGAAIKDLFHDTMIGKGIFIGNQIYITPRHKPAHIKKIIQAMEESLEVVARAIKENKVDEYLGGLHSTQVFKRGS